MAKILQKKKRESLKVSDKELGWFRNVLKSIAEKGTPVNNVRLTYQGKSEWVKVSFWCKVIRIDKEEKENGDIKAKRPND